jgi:hypothetical protein
MDWRESGGGTRKGRTDGRVGEGVNLEVGGEKGLEGRKAGGRSHVGKTEEEVGACVEEDGGEVRLLPAVFREALQGTRSARPIEKCKKSSTHSSKLGAEDQASLEQLGRLRRSRLGRAPKSDPEQVRRMKDRLPRRFRFALNESIETPFDGGKEEMERLGAT